LHFNAHRKVWALSAVSCAKMAESIEMHFGTRIEGTCIAWGCRCAHGKGHFWGVWWL